MSDSVLISMLGIIPTTIGMILSFIISFRQVQNHIELASKVNRLTETTNGKMEQLLELTAKSSKAEGVLEEQASAAAQNLSGSENLRFKT
jgi:hypothetical protein